MKKILSLILSAVLSVSFVQLCLAADFTAIPAPPYERQFSLEVEPGSKQSAKIIVKNLGNKELKLNLYGADATHSAQGTFALSTKTTEQRHIGTWISFEEPVITLPAQEEISVPFLIDVPADAPPGSYAGGIAVESSNGNGGSEETEAETSAISISSRFIVKLFLSVPGEKVHKYTLNDFYFTYSDDMSHARFIFDVSNVGNTIVMIDPKVEVAGFPPLKESILELPTATIQPGTENQTIDLRFKEKPPIGFFTAVGTATFYEYNLINNEKISPDVQTKEITINLTPTYLVVIIILVILLLLAAPIVYYFMGKRYISRCTAYIVSEGDTIITIANNSKSDWKKIASINKLKAPYTLKTGQKILIPPKK